MFKKLLVLTAILAIPVAQAEVTGPIILKSPDLGESEVLAWSWGASQSGSFHVGGGGGAGKANYQDISITRLTDTVSVTLLTKVSTGDYIPGVEILRDNLRIRLENVLVTSYSVGGSNESKKNEPQTENISLNFQRVRFEIEGAEICWDSSLGASC